MKGTPEMSVIRMTIGVSSRLAEGEEKIEYALRFPADVHIPGPSRPTNEALKGLGAESVNYDYAGPGLRFVLSANAELSQFCKVVANYLRWLHSFTGGVEFRYRCPHCGRNEYFVL